MTDNQNQLMGEMHADIKSIKEQVIRTNGRVTSLEKWRYILTGGIIAVGAMSVPTLSSLVKAFSGI